MNSQHYTCIYQFFIWWLSSCMRFRLLSIIEQRLLCFFNELEWRNFWPHWGQVYGSSPEWIILCWRRWTCCRNLLPQISQVKGFAPVCISMCVRRAFPELKIFPHILQDKFCQVLFFHTWILPVRKKWYNQKHIFPNINQIIIIYL